jgi:hypothetical protein
VSGSKNKNKIKAKSQSEDRASHVFAADNTTKTILTASVVMRVLPPVAGQLRFSPRTLQPKNFHIPKNAHRFLPEAKEQRPVRVTPENGFGSFANFIH